MPWRPEISAEPDPNHSAGQSSAVCTLHESETSASTPGIGAHCCAGFLPGLEPASSSCSAAQAQDAPAALAMEQCQNLLKRRLTRPLLELFHQLTGLRLHLWWHEPAALVAEHALMRLCPQARRTRATGLVRTCQECLRRTLAAGVDQSSSPRSALPAVCGLTNYCACLEAPGAARGNARGAAADANLPCRQTSLLSGNRPDPAHSPRSRKHPRSRASGGRVGKPASNLGDRSLQP